MLKQFVDFCIDRRALVVWVVSVTSLGMLVLATQLHIGADLSALLPSDHPYVIVHNRFKTTYGSANAVTMVMEVDDGDIFRTDFLERLRTATLELRNVEGANPEQIVSLASRKLKELRVSAEGLESSPLMFPNVPSQARDLAMLKARVIRNDLVYGHYVSHDLKAALIGLDFYDQLLRPATAFAQIRAVMQRVEAPGIRVRIMGEPMLAGWVLHYLPETLLISAATLGVLALLLLLMTNSGRGVLLPAAAALISAVWALGLASAMQITLDPLAMVVVFLVTARAVSHSVQLVLRFDDAVRAGAATSADAAKAAMLDLFRPGMLGVVADAGCMFVVMLMPIPLVKNIALVGALWLSSIAVSAVVMTPVLLSWTKLPLRFVSNADRSALWNGFLGRLERIGAGRFKYTFLAVTALALLAAVPRALRVRVGDASAGSALLQADSEYNRGAADIRARFPGTDKMFIVINGARTDAIKRPEALRAMSRLQNHMEAVAPILGSVSLADLLMNTRRLMRDGNHRYLELGRTATENGELLYLLGSGADASDMERYVDRQFRSAAVVLFAKDHRADHVAALIASLRSYLASHPLPGYEFLFAGGAIGVTAATNEVILAGHAHSIALALLVLALCCVVWYRSLSAGLLFMTPVLVANTLTFAYMAWRDIGLNIHTLPVAALGIGLGVDYSFYVTDAIREASRRGASLREATHTGLQSAGKGVIVTAGALILSLIVWCASSLRFQSEMALLIALWLSISAASALLLIPALIACFKPRFVVSERVQ